MKTTIRFIFALSFTILAGCGGGGFEAEDSPEQAQRSKGEPLPVMREDAERAVHLDLKPGVPWEEKTEADGVESSPQGYSVSEKSWPVLQAGQSIDVSFTLSSTESLAAFVHPYDFNGDVDLNLYKWDPAAGVWAYVKQSVNSVGYVDSIFTPPYTAGWDGSYILKLYCFSGACNFQTSISKGDDENFYTSSVYLNQRSFTTNNQRCKNSNNIWVADGECMCADASAAMGVMVGGKVQISQISSSAQDLFFNTNSSNGAANRDALMNRLKSNYGYGICEELPATMSNIRDRLRYKYLVLFRSKSLSTPGHYIQVRGYATQNGMIKLRVNDPMGVWTSTNVWSPMNTTSIGYGEGALVSLSAISQSDSSIIACK